MTVSGLSKGLTLTSNRWSRILYLCARLTANTGRNLGQTSTHGGRQTFGAYADIEGTLPATDLSGGKWHTSTTLNGSGDYIGQSFTAIETTNVDIIGLQVADTNYTGEFTFYMCNDEEDFTTCSGAPDYTQAVDFSGGTDNVRPESVQYRLVPIELSTPFPVTEGSQYTFYLDWVSGSVPFIDTTSATYPEASLYPNGQEFSFANTFWDMEILEI